MAFFEKSGNISRVNREISKHLEDINRKYTEIGRIVKLNCLDQVKNDDVRRLAGEIDGLLADLKKLQEELNVINGIKICPNCNAKIDINVAFCPSCGTKQAVMQQAAPAQPAVPVQPMAPVQQTAPVPMPAPTVPTPAPTVPAPAPVPMPEPVSEIAPAPMPEPSAETAPEAAPETADTAAEVSSNEPAAPEVEIPAAPSIAPPEVPAPAAIPEPASAPAPGQSVIFCIQCGSKEPAGTRFCSQCGNPM